MNLLIEKNRKQLWGVLVGLGLGLAMVNQTTRQTTVAASPPPERRRLLLRVDSSGGYLVELVVNLDIQLQSVGLEGQRVGCPRQKIEVRLPLREDEDFFDFQLFFFERTNSLEFATSKIE